jgi:phage terminase large subunit GpA-like protein
MWVMAAKDEAGEFVADRVTPTFENCPPVAQKITGQGKLHFDFDGIPFYFVGAGSKSKLQSKPIRWLYLDEVRNYPKGALETVMKRTRSFWNSRTFIVSTPDKKDDAVDRAYKQGDQRVWHFPCPKCGHLQLLKIDQLKWDTNETTHPEGKWDFDKLADTIRYECVSCGHAIKDTPMERKHIARAGRFVRLNPRAPRHKVSFHWNALLPPWVQWRSIVEEFIAARRALKNGDINPYKTFWNETLGLPWDDKLGVIEDYGFLEKRKAKYDYGETWAEEVVRFMAADKQARGGEHYWYVIRAFGRFAKSRLVAYGRVTSYAQLLEVQKQYNVKSKNAMIDTGYQATECYRFCATSGWKAFKGDPTQYFLMRDAKTGKTYRTAFDKTYVDPLHGQHRGKRKSLRAAMGRQLLPLYRWSNDMVKDLFTSYATGMIGEWTIPECIGKEYLEQLASERRVEHEKSNGQIVTAWEQIKEDNHLRDCELMIVVAALASGVISGR